MPSLKTPSRFLEAIYLDVISIPGRFMSKEDNAKWHLKHVCPHCSKWRKCFRDPKRKGNCLWLNAWETEKCEFSRDFGIKNWLRYYAGLKTDLRKYKKEFLKLIGR
mgnify:CR=1 FL=1